MAHCSQYAGHRIISFLMNICSCLVVMLVNTGLKNHGGDMYIGAYGIINRVVFLFIMIVMGFNQGMQPIAGYNFEPGRRTGLSGF